MKHDSLNYPLAQPDVGVYECEVHLKFRLIEEKGVMLDRDELLEKLLDAFVCGSDEFLEPTQVNVRATEIPETSASPQMRRKLIRLRNVSD